MKVTLTNMAIDFPSNPLDGDIVTVGNINFRFETLKGRWRTNTTEIAHGGGAIDNDDKDIIYDGGDANASHFSTLDGDID